MFNITIKGDPLDLWIKSRRIQRAVKVRKTDGWKPFQSDETWLYHWEPPKERVCPVCQANAARKSYNGTIIQVEFPMNEGGFTSIKWRSPRVHRHKPWLKGECRCVIEWVDPIGTLEKRLGKEMEAMNF